MNYLKTYNSIITNRQHKPVDCYTEKHHIVPRCMNGSNSADNLVKLTAREHFICHLLLTKIYKDTKYYYKLVKAFYFMKSASLNQKRYSDNRFYESLRKDFADAQSISQIGQLNSQFGTKWYYHKLTLVNKKFKNKPSGEWMLGRHYNKNMNIYVKPIIDKISYSKYLFKIYKDSGCNSLREFCRLGYYNKSHVSLTRAFSLLSEYKTNKGKPFNVNKN